MICSICSIDKEFHSFTTYKEGNITKRRGICEKCKNEISEKNSKELVEHRKLGKLPSRDQLATKRNKEYIIELKSKTPCADCHEIFPSVCMDFDHISDDKLSSISNLVSGRRSRSRIDIEINKCELVCSNCHRIRTHVTRKQKNV